MKLLSKINGLIISMEKSHGNVVWIPRCENEEADFWSRVVDYNDWGIQSQWFKKICNACQMIATIDRFADNENKKCARFNSRFFHHEAEAIDCFTQDWGRDKNWVEPPIHLVYIFHIISDILRTEVGHTFKRSKIPSCQHPKLPELLKNVRRPNMLSAYSGAYR